MIDKYDGYLSSLNVDGLCHELSTIVMAQTYTVYEVFNVMSERRYSQTALEQVAANLTDRINDTNLIELAKTMNGATLLARIQYLMNCAANPNQAICQRISTAFQRANDQLRETEKKKPNNTNQPRKLSEEQINYYKAKVPKGEKFNEEVVWDLPSNGTGFTVYNPDDMIKTNKITDRKKYNDDYGFDQIGIRETLERMMELARQWTTISDQKLQIGDISRPGGIDTPDHKGHQNGKIVDVRPLRNKAYATEDYPCYYTDTARYNRELTIEFIRLVRKSNLVTLIRFNDFEISGSSEFKGYVIKDANGGKVHDHHLHLEFK